MHVRALVPWLLLLSLASADSPREVLLGPRLLNVAHRGGAAEAPEQTLLAFRTALAVGADVLELDVHATRDGALVVCHDRTVDRTTDGEGRIAELTLAQVRALDAGYRFSRDGGKTFPHRGAGVRVPTFAEVLEGFPDTPLVVEVKPSDPDVGRATLAAVEAAGAAGRVVLSSAHDRVLAAIRAANPRALTGFARAEALAFAALGAADEAGYRPPGQFLQIPLQFATPQLVAKARRVGVRVHVWTVNAEADMRRLLELDVDGIMTDAPTRLARVLHGAAPPQPRRFF